MNLKVEDYYPSGKRFLLPSTRSRQSWWIVADLDQEDRTTTRPELSDDIRIVRYVRLSTLFLYLSGHAFVPSLRLLQNLKPQERSLTGGIYFPGYGSPPPQE